MFSFNAWSERDTLNIVDWYLTFQPDSTFQLSYAQHALAKSSPSGAWALVKDTLVPDWPMRWEPFGDTVWIRPKKMAYWWDTASVETKVKARDVHGSKFILTRQDQQLELKLLGGACFRTMLHRGDLSKAATLPMPPATFKRTDLIGNWINAKDGANDTLSLRADITFRLVTAGRVVGEGAGWEVTPGDFLYLRTRQGTVRPAYRIVRDGNQLVLIQGPFCGQRLKRAGP
jgi:hypothetical protein